MDRAVNHLNDRARAVFQAAVDAVDPAALVTHTVGHLPTALRRAFEQRRGRLIVVGAGKAVVAMAQATEDGLPLPLAPAGPKGRGFVPPPAMEGVIVAKHQPSEDALRRIRVVVGNHPVPGAASVGAATAVMAMLDGLSRDDVLLVLLSGGASSLLALPREGVSIAGLATASDQLLRAGVPIVALNCVRKHLTVLGGGGMARLAAPAPVLAFVISDVPGNRLDVIGSGPTVADPTTFSDVRRIIDRAKLWDTIPSDVRDYVERGLRGEVEETVKPGAKALKLVRTLLIGSNRLALDAAAARATQMGYRALVFEDELVGESREVGRRLGIRVAALKEQGRGPLALILGGETTVTVTGNGRGGRCQELAVGAALALDGVSGVSLLVASTDGEDGPTDAAGALVDGVVAAQSKAEGVDLEAALARNDSYTALAQLDALVKTGPTGTNVMDMAVALID